MTASHHASADSPASAAKLVRELPARLRNILEADCDRTQTQRDALSAFSVRIFSAALLYLMQIALARWMGGFEYGIYVSVWTWVVVLAGFADSGFHLLVIRMGSEYRETKQHELLRGLIDGSRGFVFAVGTLIATTGLIGLWLFPGLLSEHYIWPAYLALFCIPLYAMGDVQDGLGRGQAWILTALLPPYVLRPLLILLAMFAAHQLGFTTDATTAVAAAIFATWVSSLIQFLILNRRFHTIVHAGPRRFEFMKWLKVSSPLLAIGICELLIQNTDVLVVARYMSPTDVGIYFAAAKTMSLIMYVHYAVGSAVANRYAAFNARGDRDGLKAFVADSVHWTFWPSLVFAATILGVGKPVLSLFGPGFDAGYPVMLILVAGFLFRSAMGPAEFLLNMLGEQKICAAILGATALLNLLLNLALVPSYGMMGAAIATSCSLSFAALCNTITVRRRLGLEIAIWRNLAPTR